MYGFKISYNTKMGVNINIHYPEGSLSSKSNYLINNRKLTRNKNSD